jgi:hypothetical protein
MEQQNYAEGSEADQDANYQSQIQADMQKILSSPALQDVYSKIDQNKEEALRSVFNHKQEEQYQAEQEALALERQQAEQELEEASSEEEGEFEEEQEESDSEEEAEEEVEEESVEATTTKVPKERRPWYIKRVNQELTKEMRQLSNALQHAQRSLQEREAYIEALKRSEQESWQITTTQYEKALNADLNKAKQDLKEARDNYDVDKEILALDSLTNAQNQLRDLAVYKRKTQAPVNPYNDPYYQSPQQGYASYPNNTAQYQQQAPYQYNDPYAAVPYQTQDAYHAPDPAYQKAVEDANRLINGWYAKHPEVNPEEARYFNPELKNKLESYAAQYEDHLKKTGRGNLVLSDSYFKNLDDWMANETAKYRQSSKSKSISTAHIGSTKSSGSATLTNRSKKPDVTLTADDLEWIEASPIADKETLKKRLIERKAAFESQSHKR